jgi:hypothetical protein
MASTTSRTSQIWRCCARAPFPRAIRRSISAFVRAEKQYCCQRPRSQFSQISVRRVLSPARCSGVRVSHPESGARRTLSSACSTAMSRWIRNRRLPRSSSVDGDIHFLDLYGCRMINLPARGSTGQARELNRNSSMPQSIWAERGTDSSSPGVYERERRCRMCRRQR